MTEQKNPDQQVVKITPETSLAYVNDALSKYQGSRADHQVLQASFDMLKNIVAEWKSIKSQSQPKSPQPKPKAPSVRKATKKKGRTRRG